MKSVYIKLIVKTNVFNDIIYAVSEINIFSQLLIEFDEEYYAILEHFLNERNIE